MKVLFFLLLFSHTAAFAQCDTTNFVEFPDVEAKFPGGTAKLMKFIRQNINYPETLERIDIGRIRFIFFVCSDGSVVPDNSARTDKDEFDQTKIDLIQKMPNWIPAQVEDRNVTTKVMINLNINLE